MRRPMTITAALLAVALTTALLVRNHEPTADNTHAHMDHSAMGHSGGAPGAEQAAAMVAQQLAPVPGSEFLAECASSHRQGDDPIVFPNQPGASHIHEFFGNTSTNANSTLQSLRLGGTNCNPVADKSAYWVPTLYKNGTAIAPERVTIYYQGITDRANAVAYPQGLRYVVGNALATHPDQNPAARWSCVGASPSSRDFLDCPPGSRLENYLDFPTCWDGVRLDSPNHKDHMAFAAGSTCPGSHPFVVPRLEFLITYPVNGTGLSLAGTRNGRLVTDAPGYTFHGDFINAWDPAELQRRIDNCIRPNWKCGTDGNPIQQ